jgi:BolA protein
MNASSKGPVATEMCARLESALSPTRGHGGYRGEGGESHFTLRIESAAFAGLNRVQRQRLVYKALGELMHHKVHALAMETKAPGE